MFTPCLSFAARVPAEPQLRKKLRIGHGNVGWKVFTKIRPEWDSYLTQAVARAWDRFYGKGWRKKLPAATGKKLRKLDEFIPL